MHIYYKRNIQIAQLTYNITFHAYPLDFLESSTGPVVNCDIDLEVADSYTFIVSSQELHHMLSGRDAQIASLSVTSQV